jgi:hypothetical protein
VLFDLHLVLLLLAARLFVVLLLVPLLVACRLLVVLLLVPLLLAAWLLVVVLCPAVGCCSAFCGSAFDKGVNKVRHNLLSASGSRRLPVRVPN